MAIIVTKNNVVVHLDSKKEGAKDRWHCATGPAVVYPNQSFEYWYRAIPIFGSYNLPELDFFWHCLNKTPWVCPECDSLLSGDYEFCRGVRVSKPLFNKWKPHLKVDLTEGHYVSFEEFILYTTRTLETYHNANRK